MRARATTDQVTKADRRIAKKQRKSAPADNRKSIHLIASLSKKAK